MTPSEDKPEYEYEYYYDYLDEDNDKTGHVADYDLVPLANKVRPEAGRGWRVMLYVSGANIIQWSPPLSGRGGLPSPLLLQKIC